MKKCFLIMSFLIFYVSTNAHQQHVHQYLTQEGYKLLKNYIGGDITQMLSHLGNGPVGPIWTNGTLTAGAWREDEEDIVYGYYQVCVGDPTGALIPITHFWDADRGDASVNSFDVSWWFFTGNIGPYENAYTKISHFAYGGYILFFNIYPYIRVQKPNGQWLRLIPGTPHGVALSYSSIIDLYKYKRLTTEMIGSYMMYNESTGGYEYFFGTVYVSDDFRDKLVWEILGRMCHLIQDMSVPAHTRCDEHGLTRDDYEYWVAENNHWTYWNANNSGGLLNPYVSSNPIHYLMYTTQQIANHFGSSGPYCSVGNNLIGGNPLPEEISYLNSINLSTLGEPVGQGPFNNNTETNIRNKTLPQAIRATAGLLYWFAAEAGIMPLPLAVSISGPTSIALGPAGQSTWTATVVGGHPPYHYQWWYKYPGGLPPLSINSTNDNTDIGIKSLTKSKTSKIDTVLEELLPGGGTWYQLSETSSSLTTYWYSNFYLKCVVTDANNTSVTSNILYVTVGGSSSQTAPLAQDDLAKIGVEGKIGTEEKITEDKLLQNYPNPFNPTTQINYAVKEDGFVELKVYDLLGKVVATLVNENKPAGFYSVSFDASRLSSGIYFYTIKTNNFFDRKKMIFVK